MDHPDSATGPSNHEASIRKPSGVTSPEPESRSSKRLKRGNYVSKACGQCQRRKIKCDGSIPCQPCVFNDRDCRMIAVDMRRRKRTLNPSLALGKDRVDLSGDDRDQRNRPTTRELASRLDQIERQLSDVLSAVSRRPVGSTAPEIPSDQSPTARETNGPDTAQNHASRTAIPGRGRKEGFSGETSIDHALEEIEGYVRHVRELHPQPEPSASSEASLLPPPSPRGNSQHTSPSETLRKHGITPDIRKWSIFVQTFCDEVHILFPFLHLPTLWTNHTTMWNHRLLTSSVDGLDSTADNRFMIAQTWICVAIGKCTASPRSSTQEGKHSSGWSLYRASLELIGDLLHSYQDCSDQMLVLQTLALMVVYLFRVDANERAEKILAIAISHAHHLGLHRSKVVNAMTAFNSELFRRLWWCLYVLDRRMAIETGHPVLIQDVNVDTPHPQNLGDGWLASHQLDQNSCLNLSADINVEVDRDIVTPIPYLVATIHYSRVVGNVWEAVYGARDSNLIPSASLLNHLENIISQTQREVRPEFSTLEGPCLQQGCRTTSTLPWWRTKQQMVMRIRWLCLRLLIRKPVLRGTSSLTSPDNDTTCLNIARDILQEFCEVQEAKAKSAFPFLHYLVGATTVSLGLIARQPDSKHAIGTLTLQTASSLERYCQNTWVSGKMVRTIWKLNRMVKTVMQNPVPSGSSVSAAQNPSVNFASDRLIREGFDPHCALPNLFRGNRLDLKPGPIGSTAARSPEISNLMNTFDPNAPFYHTQSPQLSVPAENPNLPMADFDFEESAKNFSTGIQSSGDQRSVPAFSQLMNPAWLPWSYTEGQPVQSVDAELQELFATDMNGYAGFLAPNIFE